MSQSVDDTPLLLDNTVIFPDSNIIDNIRQTYINLHSDLIKIEAIQYFFEDCQPYLQGDLPYQTATELFAIFSFYFSDPEHWGKLMDDKLRIFKDILENAKSSANYIIIVVLLLSEFTHCRLQLDLPDFNPLINDAISEIIPQIKNNVNGDLKVFNHIIPSQFKNSFIINLLLSAKLSEELIHDFFPYIFSLNLFSKEPKIALLFRDISNLKLIKIQPQTDSSYNDLSEFITNKDVSYALKMSKESISLLEYSALFALTEGRCETNSLTIETVLQFIAITLIFLQNYNKTVNFSVNLTNLVIDATKLFESNNLPYLRSSIDTIISNYLFICKRHLIPINAYIQILSILLPHFLAGDYTGDRSLLLFSILDLTTRGRETEFNRYIISFFNTHQIPLFEYIFGHKSEIEQFDQNKLQKIDLKYFERNLFIEHMLNLNTSDLIIEFLTFVDKFCTNEPEMNSLTNVSTHLFQFLQEEIQAKNWDNVLLIGYFMQKNNFYDDLNKIKEVEGIPLEIQEMYFDYQSNDKEELDDLLSHMIADPKLDEHVISFTYLYKQMIKDKDLFDTYLGFLMAKSRFRSTANQVGPSYVIESAYPIFLEHKESIFEAASKCFYYDEEKKVLVNNLDYDVDKLKVSEKGLSIVSKLFDAIKEKPFNYQPYLILYNIAQSFPNLFQENPQQIIDIVFPILDYFPIIYDNIVDNDHNKLKILKTFISAIHFLVSTFRSSIVFNHFINWCFKNIESFTDSQLASFSITLTYISVNKTGIYSLQPYIMKYKFIDTVNNLLKRRIPNEKLDKCIRFLLCNFICDEINNLSHFNKYELIQINALMNSVDNPINFFYNFLFCGYPHDDTNIYFIIVECSSKFIDYQKLMFAHEKDYFLSYDLNQKKVFKATQEEIDEFVQHIPK